MINADLVINTFAKHQQAEIAFGQEKYMKNHFQFFGIPSPKRKDIQKSWLLKKNLPSETIAFELAFELFKNPHRECHYFAIELLEKYSKNFDETAIIFLEFLICKHSWWDTVDFISSKLVGNYFKTFPQKRDEIIDKWLTSKHLWLIRSALLFQLKYKENLDTQILTTIIKLQAGSKEFFINKAIGWILREYSKTNPKWVNNFITVQNLHPLSVREASKYL